MPPRGKRALRPKKPAQLRPLAAVVHGVLLLSFLAVLGWHLTPEANKQEVAKKQGWFFNYLTFFGFILQLVQFGLCLAADLQGRGAIVRFADDVSCAAFPIATFITASYYVLLLSGNIVDSDEVPKWVSPVLHQGNFVALCADLVVSRDQRSFSPNAAYITAAVDIVYCTFCFTTRQINGSYPYVFMEKLPEPWGVISSGVVLVVVTEALFILGRRMSRYLS